ncbi:MAG: hypothetical protein AVDCRST_MAG16-3014, partial [uncultured Frankineae bacterium]
RRDLRPGERQRGGRRQRLPHVPPGRLGRQLRGPEHHRPRRPRPPAVPDVHRRRPRHRLAARHRRGARLV